MLYYVLFLGIFMLYSNVILCSIFRYLYALQIKKDLSIGQMVCSENTAALLASYIVQGKEYMCLQG